MRGWLGVTACMGLSALAIAGAGCGRFGFELLSHEDADPPWSNAGAGGSSRAGQGGSDGAGGSGMARPDGGMAGAGRAAPVMDGGLPDAAVDPRDGGMQPIADAGDAGSDDDGGDEVPPPECQVNAVADYCSELPELPVAPVIDGEIECDLALRDVTPVGWTNATSPLPAGQGVRFAAAWRADGVYFFLEVTDATRLPPPSGQPVWCGDGVELYLDDDGTLASAPLYDAPGSIQVLATAPADDASSVSAGGERWRSPNGGVVGGWTSPRYAAFPRGSGYVFEAFMQADDLDLASWSLARDAKVGLDLAVNVSISADPPPPDETPECARRLGQYFLRTAPEPCTGSCLPFSNTAAFCTPTLVD